MELPTPSEYSRALVPAAAAAEVMEYPYEMACQTLHVVSTDRFTLQGYEEFVFV